ncbi:helix-turn-helix domain-containing protein [Rhizobium sp. RCAM05973]|uniref:TetR/AcrR family transcriptional regulator n=1 Tax=Rhizobium sp. RCAM05973 TaxID=2994066 RepID=UPI0032B81BA7
MAKTVFADQGVDVSLNEIARRAGVGIGTLYRHFPTRGAIVEAVYRREVEQSAGSASRLLGSLPPAWPSANGFDCSSTISPPRRSWRQRSARSPAVQLSSTLKPAKSREPRFPASRLKAVADKRPPCNPSKPLQRY